MAKQRINELARVLWDYHRMGRSLPEEASFVLALGSHDDRVAEKAADLILAAVAPLLVASGGYGKVTSETHVDSEGQRFKRIAVTGGVPPEQILVEDQASNTGENISRTRDLLLRHGVEVESGILVSKPYMERRSWATAERQWPEVRWFVTSPDVAFEDYPNDDVPFRRMVELMVGDLQRMKLYGERGFQIPQDIPTDVWAAYESLVEAGYDRFVLGS